MLNTTFKTVVSEYGVGIEAESTFSLRVEMEALKSQKILGLGFGLDALLARFASEGEAIERSTWQYGALWNSAYFTYGELFLPENVSLLFSKEDEKEIMQLPSFCYGGEDSKGKVLSIPYKALFFYPKWKQFGNQHSVTTGWAFHSSKREALAQGYREVIERDLQMLFWHDRLGEYLTLLPQHQVDKYLEVYGKPLVKGSKFYLLQMPLKLHNTIHDKGYFTLVVQLSEEAPYVTTGSAVKEFEHDSFHSAMGELIVLRSYQYEMLLTDVNNSDEFSFESHIAKAIYEKSIRDKIEKMLTKIAKNGSQMLDYSKNDYQVVYLDPPPETRKGVVAKVWVDNTQGITPAGFKYKICSHWKKVWKMTQREWQENVWHPYP